MSPRTARAQAPRAHSCETARLHIDSVENLVSSRRMVLTVPSCAVRVESEAIVPRSCRGSRRAPSGNLRALLRRDLWRGIRQIGLFFEIGGGSFTRRPSRAAAGVRARGSA